MRNTGEDLVRNPEYGRLDLNWEFSIKMDLKHAGSQVLTEVINEEFYLPG
jgi:hypothetical protein